MTDVPTEAEAARLRTASWQPMCGPYAAFDAGFTIMVDDRALRELVARVFVDLQVSEGVPTRHEQFRVSHTQGQGGVVLRGPAVLGRASHPAEVMGLLVWGANRWVLDQASRHRLLLHAGGVVDGDRAALLAGPSGSGKSTLTTALVRAGLAYLSDEAVELGEDGLVHGYPKPLSIDPGAFALFPDLAPPDTDPAAAFVAEQWQVPAGALSTVASTATLGAVIFPTYRHGHPTELSWLSPSAALRSAAASTFAPDNGVRVERWQVEQLARALAGVPAYRLDSGFLDEAAEAVRGVLTDHA